jgi:hypothetical protein
MTIIFGMPHFRVSPLWQVSWQNLQLQRFARHELHLLAFV